MATPHLNLVPTPATAPPPAQVDVPIAPDHRDVEIVIPVYNESPTLERSVRRLHHFLTESLPFTWRIVIADNASTDDTFELARGLCRRLPDVEAIHLPAKGRGRALRLAWSAAAADVLCYMDVDLSTDLAALLPLIAPLHSGHSELAIGTRLHRDARVRRSPKRELISRSYNHLLRFVLRARFSDAQCGFKAIRAEAADGLLPEIRDQAWFFDTELLVLAQRRGLRIHEVPVDWIEDPDSRVQIAGTALADLRGVTRLLADSPAARFIAVGALSTVAYASLYLVLRAAIGAAAANALALGLTALGNTAANRRLTFGVQGRERLGRHLAMGTVVFVVTLALTDGALAVLGRLVSRPPRWLEVSALVLASACATAMRYVALNGWVFAGAPRQRHGPPPDAPVPAAQLFIPAG